MSRVVKHAAYDGLNMTQLFEFFEMIDPYKKYVQNVHLHRRRAHALVVRQRTVQHINALVLEDVAAQRGR